MALTPSGGYVVDRKLYREMFEGDLDGLWMVARSSSVAAYRRIASLAEREVADPPSAADIAAMSDLYAAFAAVLVDWNLEEPAGHRVPTSVEGVESQEPALVNALVAGWLDAVQRALPGSASHDMSAEEIEATLGMTLPGELEPVAS
jgi:hypothetical protein